MPTTVPQEQQHPAAAPRPGRALTDGQQLLVGVDAVIILRGWRGEQRQSHFLFLECHEEQDAGSQAHGHPNKRRDRARSWGCPTPCLQARGLSVGSGSLAGKSKSR